MAPVHVFSLGQTLRAVPLTERCDVSARKGEGMLSGPHLQMSMVSESHLQATEADWLVSTMGFFTLMLGNTRVPCKAGDQV